MRVRLVFTVCHLVDSTGQEALPGGSLPLRVRLAAHTDPKASACIPREDARTPGREKAAEGLPQQGPCPSRPGWYPSAGHAEGSCTQRRVQGHLVPACREGVA